MIREIIKKGSAPLSVIIITFLFISIISMSGCKEGPVEPTPPTVTPAPANLVSSITAQPDPVGQNATITVIMTVSNTGGYSSNEVIPAGFNIGGSCPYLLQMGPSPTSATITANSYAVFTWLFRPIGTGTIYFTASAQGTDAESGLPVVSNATTSNVVDVMPNYPVINSWISVIPNTVNINQIYTIILSVSNVGVVIAHATNTYPLSGIIGTMATGPAPSSSDIAVGGYQGFTWTYTAPSFAAGPSSVSGSAASGGQESIDITCCNTNSITIQP